MKPLGIITIVLIGVMSSIAIHATKNRQTCQVITVFTPNGRSINAEVARTPGKQQRGLSNRRSLEPNAGMLFLFPKKDYYTFWMKDTFIPLDIIWLDGNRVVEMKQLTPQNGSEIPQYTPAVQANSVLEIGAGQANQYAINLGSQLVWSDQC